MEATQSWEQWKRALAQAVGAGQRAGLSQEEIVNRAEKLGDYLAREVDPNNPQQRLLLDLWQAGNDDEQQALASMIVKMVSPEHPH